MIYLDACLGDDAPTYADRWSLPVRISVVSVRNPPFQVKIPRLQYAFNYTMSIRCLYDVYTMPRIILSFLYKITRSLDESIPPISQHGQGLTAKKKRKYSKLHGNTTSPVPRSSPRHTSTTKQKNIHSTAHRSRALTR